jgi:hypothetical protein
MNSACLVFLHLEEAVMKDQLFTTADIERLVRDFENCQVEPEQFKHRQHLVVALWYVRRLGEAQAGHLMRTKILRFIEHHGIDPKLYHETITQFWIKLIAVFVRSENNAKQSLADLANRLMEEYGDSRLIDRFYSKELLESEEARKKWVEPDLTRRDSDE